MHLSQSEKYISWAQRRHHRALVCTAAKSLIHSWFRVETQKFPVVVDYDLMQATGQKRMPRTGFFFFFQIITSSLQYSLQSEEE